MDADEALRLSLNQSADELPEVQVTAQRPRVHPMLILAGLAVALYAVSELSE